MSNMKRSVKDSVFTYLFRQPEYTRALYLSLHPEDDAVTADDFQLVTLETVLSTGQYNDLGFLVHARLMVLVEAQSTFTVNVCLRMLMYLAQSYKEYAVEHELDLYSTSPVSIPCPELYVVYTGTEPELPDTLQLSSLFGGGGSLELTVRVLRRTGSGDILDQYIRFCEIQTEQHRRYGYTQEAIDETMRLCREEKILTLFLASREKEVRDIMFTLFDQEWVTRIHEKNLVRTVTEEVTKSVTEEVTKSVTEEVTKSVTEEVTKNVTEEVTKKVTKEVTKEVTKKHTLDSVRNLMESLGLTSAQAMNALKIPSAEQPEYQKLLESST